MVHAIKQTHGAMWLFFAIMSLPTCAEQPRKTWKDYGGGADCSHFVALNQINRSNVNQLEVAWTYPTGDNNSYLFNPVVVDHVMYVLARNNSLVALDATTRKEIWIHENLRGIAPRGINYWESKDRKDRRLIFQMNHFLQEIDARTGKSILAFGKNGLVDLREGLGRDPKTVVRIQSSTPGRIFENLILLGSAPGEEYLSAPGDVRAFDVITGRMAWAFHTIPHPGEFGYETWPKDAWRYSGGANTWGEITVDDKRGIAYFPTGSPTYDYYGADRIGSNLFSDCLLALDARTGKRLWHFQFVHHDLWDYDTASAPQLLTVRHNGKLIDAVAQATKQGFLFVFDRVTGKPLWPIEERPVPKSDVPGEQAWPTQPFPTVLPPFARQKMTVDDINPYLLTARERAKWKDVVGNARTGLFTPPARQSTIALPGARGGSNWGATAADPEKGLMFVITQDWPTQYQLSLKEPNFGPSFGRRAILSQVGLAFLLSSSLIPAGGSHANILFEYRQNCQGCHGANGVGTLSAPSLAGIGARLNLEDFRQVIAEGKGKMPAFPNLERTVPALYTFLSRGQQQMRLLGGPVVASGGAPGGLEIPSGSPQPLHVSGPPYPAGLDVPRDRFYTAWGFDASIISPPWSSVVAYDLNTGCIKWRIPLGEDAQAVAEGARNTGTFGSRSGAVVTSSGLIFIAARDGKVRAYDEDTGKALWTAILPASSEGIPAMYEVGGRQYLVVSASSAYSNARDPSAAGTAGSVLNRGYVAFALPEKSKAAK